MTVAALAMALLPFDMSAAKAGVIDHEDNVNLIVCNDTGRNGYYRQKPMAEMMAEVADSVDAQAVLALGDVHHFDGVASTADPLWLTNYELVYSHPALMIPWYPVLGNHEYRGNTQAVIDYSKVSRRWQMPARYYSKLFTEGNVTVKVVFIDTTPLIDKYRADGETYPDAGRQDLDAQMQWIEGELRNRQGADWLVVVGHHPIYADTPKDGSERADMQRRVGALIKSCGGVDLYICGHIHNFQHINNAALGVDCVVNSAASLSRKKVHEVEGTKYCNGDEGFSVLSASKDKLTLYMVNYEGRVLHTVDRIH